MNRVDVHPDELLDLEGPASRTPEERARLEQHLAQCPACAFEVAASHDFARWLDHASPADEPAAARAAEGAAAALGLPVTGTAVREKPLGPQARWGRRLVVAATLVALTAVAGAAAWVLWLAPPAGESRSAAAASPPVRSTAPDARAPIRTPALQPSAPPSRPQPEPPAASSAPPAAVEPPAEPPAASIHGVAIPHHEHAPAPTPVAPPAAIPSPAEPTAAQLLLHADEVRRSGAYAEAAELYRDLQRRFPGTREDAVSCIALGRVLLDQLGDPTGALDRFDRYVAIAPDGALAEEALVGRALALERLGRDDDERAAWTTLLARFPDSAHAARARARIAELAGAGS